MRKKKWKKKFPSVKCLRATEDVSTKRTLHVFFYAIHLCCRENISKMSPANPKSLNVVWSQEYIRARSLSVPRNVNSDSFPRVPKSVLSSFSVGAWYVIFLLVRSSRVNAFTGSPGLSVRSKTPSPCFSGSVISKRIFRSKLAPLRRKSAGANVTFSPSVNWNWNVQIQSINRSIERRLQY